MTQTIESLLARVAELEAENTTLAENLRMAKWERSQDELLEQLAAEQAAHAAAVLSNVQLREAIESVCCDPDGNVCIGIMGGCYADKEILEQALATPISTEALDKYVAEKVKEVEQRLERRIADITLQAERYVSLQTTCHTLTRQRDLAVEALENIRYHQEITPVLTYQGMEQIALNALKAIKESEGK